MNDIEENKMDFESESTVDNLELNNEDEEQREYLKRKMEEIENEEKIKEAERIKKQQEYQAEFLNYLNNKKKQKIFKQLCAIWLKTNTLKKIARKLKIINDDSDERFIEENMEFFRNNINLSNDSINNIDNRVCRICFGGANEVLESGKLISPCKCKGSMKYVHVNCLNEWRLASANKASYYQCDQCKYKYHFQRTKFAKVLSNKLFIFLITILITYLYIFFTGFLLKAIIKFKNYKIGNLKFKEVGLLDVGLEHHIYGFFTIGMYGALKMTYSYLFDVTTVTNSFFRISRGKRNNRDDDQVTIIILLVIGCINFMYDEYKSVYRKSKESLTILEERILEVNEDDDEDDDKDKKSK